MILVKELCAYCHTTQRWVTGEAARPILARQYRETVALLQSPMGPFYAASIGIPDREAFLAAMLDQLADLEAITV